MGTVVQVDLGKVEPDKLEPALDPIEGLPREMIGSRAIVELDEDLVALAP